MRNARPKRSMSALCGAFVSKPTSRDKIPVRAGAHRRTADAAIVREALRARHLLLCSSAILSRSWIQIRERIDDHGGDRLGRASRTLRRRTGATRRAAARLRSGAAPPALHRMPRATCEARRVRGARVRAQGRSRRERPTLLGARGVLLPPRGRLRGHRKTTASLSGRGEAVSVAHDVASFAEPRPCSPGSARSASGPTRSTAGEHAVIHATRQVARGVFL